MPNKEGLDEATAQSRPRREFCFFGDVEPDSISLEPRNRAVWKLVAEKFAAGYLNTIFVSESLSAASICYPRDSSPPTSSGVMANDPADLMNSSSLSQIESSYVSSRPDDALFGHLTPRHLLEELASLASLLPSSLFTPHDSRREKPLEGLKVMIMHCKEVFDVSSPESLNENERHEQDNRCVRERVLEELMEGEQKARDGQGLGCTFVGVERGMRIGKSR